MTYTPTNVTLPLTPDAVTGSPDPNPLVSPQQYQAITGDTTSGVEDVTEAITDAVDIICKECNRTLLYGRYTEAQFLYKNGMVYPSATPIDISQNISTGEVIYNAATDGGASSIVQGDGVWVGWFTPLPWMPVWTGIIPPQTVLTYWGGFTQSTLPPGLRRLIAQIAYKILNFVTLEGMPGGVKSMSVGGVSISGDLSAFVLEDPAMKRAIRRWRHPQVQPWQT